MATLTKAGRLFVAEDAADLAVGVDGRLAEGGGGSLEVVGGDAPVEVGDLAAEVLCDATPVGLGASRRAPRLEAFAIGVARTQEVCARAVERRAQLIALPNPRQREQVVLEDAQRRARDLTGEQVAPSVCRTGGRARDAAAPQPAPEHPAENLFPLHPTHPPVRAPRAPASPLRRREGDGFCFLTPRAPTDRRRGYRRGKLARA